VVSWIAIDGSKFRAVASVDSTRERLALQRYLDSIEKADEEKQASIDPSAVQTALEKLKQHPEPEVGFMFVRQTALPAYNVQTAVDAEHALIVAHAVVLDASDIRCLKPMAEARPPPRFPQSLQAHTSSTPSAVVKGSSVKARESSSPGFAALSTPWTSRRTIFGHGLQAMWQT
jgi:hypothetical protein